jgi:hypothetical protein
MNKVLGIIAEFSNTTSLYHAAEKIRDKGFTKFDCHSPFPIHGMDDAMGMKRSKLAFIIAIFALIGALVGFGLQTWTHSIAYPNIISGKPFFAWQSYIVITFALFVLFGAFASVFGMLKLNKLPRFHHPVFYSDNFEKKASNDGFFVSIESDDPLFNKEETSGFLKSIGGIEIELLEEK